MKLMIGLPWYEGPDGDTTPLYFDQMIYYGGLMERSFWVQQLGVDKAMEHMEHLPALDGSPDADGLGEPTREDWERIGQLKIAVCNYMRTSLVGLARERVAESAQMWDADYLFWWDADMKFPASTLLQLLRHDKPMVGALAFTARYPFHPVLYRIREKKVGCQKMMENSDVVMDYPLNQLVGNDDIGGELSTGGAVVLYNMMVFKEVETPWFTSTGCGEDWFFCHRLKDHNISRFVDTSIKVQHKEHTPQWVDGERYWKARKDAREDYVRQFGETISTVSKEPVVTDLYGSPLQNGREKV